MVVAAANLVTKHGIDKLEIDTDYFESDHNFLHDGRRKHKHDDDIMSMTGDADAEGMLKVSLQKIIVALKNSFFLFSVKPLILENVPRKILDNTNFEYHNSTMKEMIFKMKPCPSILYRLSSM